MKTDAQLQQDVMAELKWEPAVHATQIGVEVQDGVVTLSGEVGSYIEKWNAERAAQRVSGVTALAIDLKVKLLPLDKRSDSDIAASVRNVLSWSKSFPANAIKVLVEDGWVTLSGQVQWHYQSNDAAEIVRFIRGVVGVSNQITLEPRPSASAVKSDIVAAINRHAIADAKKIAVEVMGSEVTLTGHVQSWAERELVLHSVWRSPGVHKIIDKMSFAY